MHLLGQVGQSSQNSPENLINSQVSIRKKLKIHLKVRTRKKHLNVNTCSNKNSRQYNYILLLPFRTRKYASENFSSFIHPSLPNFPTRSITPTALTTSPGPFSFIYHGPRKSLERKRFNNVSTLFLHFICHLLPGHSCLRSTDTCHKRTLRYQSRPCLKKTLAIKIDRTNCSVKISFDPL